MRPFVDGEIIKEAMLLTSEALFGESEVFEKIKLSIEAIQLSPRTVSRRIELISSNLSLQIIRDIDRCSFFSLQFDESIDVSDTAQLCVIIRIIFNDFSFKEELLSIIHLKGLTRGIDIYEAFILFLDKSNISLQKLTSISTDGAPSMLEKYNGFISLCGRILYFLSLLIIIV
ncbi:Zinc finger MYM-type protein 6 [Dictyocoela muelleri]|nr:Zinc finger MYM-type protein 6 [Dictyocoela muelleri]